MESGKACFSSKDVHKDMVGLVTSYTYQTKVKKHFLEVTAGWNFCCDWTVTVLPVMYMVPGGKS